MSLGWVFFFFSTVLVKRGNVEQADLETGERETEMGTEVERVGQGEKQLAGEEKIVQVKKSHLSKTMEVDLEKYVNIQSFVHIGLSHKWLLQSI